MTGPTQPISASVVESCQGEDGTNILKRKPVAWSVKPYVVIRIGVEVEAIMLLEGEVDLESDFDGHPKGGGGEGGD